MSQELHYEKTKAYYERVGNQWGLYHLNPYVVESFKYECHHETVIAVKAGITNNRLVVLDCGCGFGQTMKVLEQQYPTNQYVGLTISPHQHKHRQHENVMLGNFENLEFYDGVMDVVYFIESFNHAYNKKRTLSEAFRVLRKGGRLFILDQCVTDENYRRLLHDANLRKQYRLHRDFYGAKPVSPDYIIRMAKKVGFKLKECDRDAKNHIARNEVMASLKKNIIVEYLPTVYSDFVFVK